MYKIINAEGRELGMTERPYYIRLSESGSYTPCSEKEAQGVVLNGTPYHLFGRASMEGMETVVLAETDSGHILQEQEAVNSIAFVTLAEAGNIDTVTAEEHMELFAPWAYPADYKVGNLRRYNGRLYKCIGDHTSQADWAPDVSVSLWAPTSDPAEEWPEWSQPIGAHDAYNAGDKVSHSDKKWTSDLDGNVWEPGVYGWSEVQGDEVITE